MVEKKFVKHAKQIEAIELVKRHPYTLLYGGSRSGKTIILIYVVVVRALSKKSRHAILRFRFNDVKTSIGMDTLPKLLEMLGVPYELNRADWVFRFMNGSEIWLGGLDDKNRVEKILGREYSTIYINEASQVSYHAYTTALTRLAENVGFTSNLALIDCNPPEKGHWLYKVFVLKQQPESDMPLKHPESYGSMLMNPMDNPHLTKEYLDEILESLPERQRRRYKLGEWLDKRQGALWTYEMIHSNRVTAPPGLVRIVVAVDPAVTHNEGSDETGIIVAGLGDDNHIYVLADYSIKGTVYEWGSEVVRGYHQHYADAVCGEVNQGGDLIESNIKNIDPQVKYIGIRAYHGKYLRAEPVAGMYEMGMVHHVGYFPELEEQMCEWAPGDDQSPDRMDALVYATTILMGNGSSGIQPNNPTPGTQSRQRVSPYGYIARPPAFGSGRR